MAHTEPKQKPKWETKNQQQKNQKSQIYVQNLKALDL